MPAADRVRAAAAPGARWAAILSASLAAHLILLAALGSAAGLIRRPPAAPVHLDIQPLPDEAWPDFARRSSPSAAAPSIRTAVDTPQARPEAVARALTRPADPEAIEEARAQGVEPVWRVQPEGLAERLANLPPSLIRRSGGGVPRSWRERCGLPLEGPVSDADRRACEQRFLADAEPPPSMRRQRPQGDPAAQFAAQGARNLAEYEAQREPLAGGAGIVGSGECPGGNLGMGCAGAHLQSDMRHGATTNIRQRGNRSD